MTDSSAANPAGLGKRGAGATTALILLAALSLVNYIDRYVLPGVQTLIQQEFRISDAQVGLLTTAFFFTYMIAAPLTGWLGDRLPRKPLIVAGALLWSAATLLTAVVRSYETLLIRHAVVGIGEATFCIFAPAMLADFYPESERNRVLSFFYITIPVGAALGYLTGGELGSRFGWRNPFFLSALPGVLIAILFWVLVREPKRGAADRLQATVHRSTVRGLFRNPAFWVATLGMALMVFAMGGMSVWLPTFFERYGGYSLAEANRWVGGITVVDGILGTWIGGWIAQRWLGRDHRALYLLSAWSALLMIPFGVLVFFGPRAWLIPSAFAAEFLLFLNTGPLNAALLNSVGASIRSSAVAINLFMIHALGDAPSPRIIGYISDRSSLRLGLGATLISLLASAVLLFAGSRFAPLLGVEETSTAEPIEA